MTNPVPPSGEREYWLDDPRNVDRVYWAIVGLCALLFLADAFYVKHPGFDLEKVFGFYGLYGFAAGVGLVLASKELRRLLKRNEDYYDSGKDDR